MGRLFSTTRLLYVILHLLKLPMITGWGQSIFSVSLELTDSINPHDSSIEGPESKQRSIRKVGKPTNDLFRCCPIFVLRNVGIRHVLVTKSWLFSGMSSTIVDTDVFTYFGTSGCRRNTDSRYGSSRSRFAILQNTAEWQRDVTFSLVNVNGTVVALTFFRSLKTFRLTFLRMCNKCKIINVQRKDKAFTI